MREKLKQLDIKITELAEYLNLSRPTIYSYIDAYEAKEFAAIDKGVFDLFKYIDKNFEIISKRSVINYILKNGPQDSSVKETPESIAKAKYGAYIDKYGLESAKAKLIGAFLDGAFPEKLIPYLAECSEIFGKKELSDKEAKRIEPLLQMAKEIGINIKVKSKKKGD